MLRIIATLILALACAQALADPPVRVARVAYVRGPVSFSPAGTNDWAVAGLNRPLVAGDRVWTDNGGRDELQLGGVALRMDGATLLSILTLDDRALQVQLSQGSLNLRVRPGPAAGTVEVDTPNLALTIDQPGHYRVSVDPAGNTTAVRVDDGQAQATWQYQAYTLNSGQDFLFSGPDLRNAQALDPRYRDDFDRWCAERDRRADRARAARYVSPAMIGYEDLDDYGTWRSVPEYGNVWMPRSVPRGWAPYRDGHWAWIEPYGWTWIDDAPWGFSTMHYGRWANMNGSWGWVPEPANALPVYAPALVAFAAGALFLDHDRRRHEPDVAWFPLAPHEAYRPPYQASPRYLGAINFNARNAANTGYRNRMVNGAVTAVPASVFTRAQPVRGAGVAVPSARIAQAPVVVAPQVQAGRESRASHITGGHRPEQALLARPAMTRMRPAIAGAPHTPAAATQAPQPVPTQPGRPAPPANEPRPPVPQREQALGHQAPGHGMPERAHEGHAAQQRGVPMPPPALQAQSAVQHGREAAPGPREMTQAPREARPGQREAMPGARDGMPGTRRTPPGPRELAPVPHAIPPGPHGGNPHQQAAPARLEPVAPHPVPRPEPAQPQPAPRAEPPHPPAPRPEPMRAQPPAPRQEPRPAPHPQPAPHPAEPPRPQPHPAPPQAAQASNEGHPQHGHGEHKGDQH